MILAFGTRVLADRPPPDAASWTKGAAWLPADDAPPVLVRYRDPTQMGKVYLLPAGVERPVPGLGKARWAPTPSTRR